MAHEVIISDAAKIRAAERAITKKAPFHKQKNSVADAVLAETFQEFRVSHASEYETFRFVTIMSRIFPAKTTGSHTTISQIFLTAAALYSLTPQALPSRICSILKNFTMRIALLGRTKLVGFRKSCLRWTSCSIKFGTTAI